MATEQPFSPTPYSDVNVILDLLLQQVQAALGEKLVGFYLYGSLSLGDFDPASSDIDFLAVTSQDLAAEDLDKLQSMHAVIASSGLPYAQRLEGSYIPSADLRRYDPENATHPTIGIDWDFIVAAHGSNWVLERAIVREYGAALYGPPPATLIDPVSAEDLRAAVCDSLGHFWTREAGGQAAPEWLRPREYQAFAILTMCRALYTLEHGALVTKPQAAGWALQNLDSRWRPTIERALEWRNQHEDDDMSDMLSFVRFALAKGKAVCEN